MNKKYAGVKYGAEFTIDTNQEPFVPFGHWEVARHLRGGDIRLKDLTCFSAMAGNREGKICPQTLLQEVREFRNRWRTVNACVLNFLLRNPRSIPMEWEAIRRTGEKVVPKRVFFLDTLFRDRTSPEDTHVLFIYDAGRKWKMDYQSLDETYADEGSVVAVVRIPLEQQLKR